MCGTYTHTQGFLDVGLCLYAMDEMLGNGTISRGLGGIVMDRMVGNGERGLGYRLE